MSDNRQLDLYKTYGFDADSIVISDTKFSQMGSKLKSIIGTQSEDMFSRIKIKNKVFKDCDLSFVDFSNTILEDVEFRRCELHGAKFNDSFITNCKFYGCSGENIIFAYCNIDNTKFKGCKFSNASLNHSFIGDTSVLNAVDLSNSTFYRFITKTSLGQANISNSKDLLSPIDFLNETFEKTEEGYIVYKTFEHFHAKNPNWVIEPENIITEVCNFSRETECGCGINVASLDWVKLHCIPSQTIYKLLIRYEWLSGVCVPYNTDGKIRCERAQIIGEVENENE